MSKIHIMGTNNRVVCGRRVYIHTKYTIVNEEATCENCLGRVFPDLELFYKYRDLKKKYDKLKEGR